jgi:hypothetical protein
MYLPPKESVTKAFLWKVLHDTKRLLGKHEVQIRDFPMYKEF